MKIDILWAKFTFKLFGAATKTKMLRQLQRMAEANVPISKALDNLYNNYSKNGKKPSDSTAVVINDWRRKYSSGKMLSKSMEGWISPTEQMIIEAGEQGSKLSTALNDALIASTAGKKLKNIIIFGSIYPVSLILILAGIIYGFSTTMVPEFSSIVPTNKWTGAAAQMYHVSEIYMAYGAPIGLGIVGYFIFSIFSLPYLTGPTRNILDKVPPYNLYKVIVGASFMISMRGFILSGVSVHDALRKVMSTAPPYLKYQVGLIYKQVSLGHNLGVAMQRSKRDFPDPEIMGELAIYADLPKFGENLDLLAKEWIDGSVEKTALSMKFIGTVIMMLLALIVMFIAGAMFELQSIIANSAN